MHIGVDLAKSESEVTVYTIGGAHYRVRAGYYLASCDTCGWIGSSEDCGTDEADDVFCANRDASGADGGNIAKLAEDAARRAAVMAFR